MAQLPKRDPAKSLLDILRQPMPTDEALDARISEYIDAELAGEDAAAMFPDVHAYILSNDDAGALYADLIDAAMADLSVEPLEAAAMPAEFKPDLSFLKNIGVDAQSSTLASTPSSNLASDAPSTSGPLADSSAGALNAWQTRIAEFAQKLARLLQPKVELHFEDFIDFFFEERSDYPDSLSLQSGTSSAFGAVEGDVPDELRWLEATYQFARLRGTTSDLAQLAQTAATNAGLPKSIHKQFIAQMLAWPEA